MSHAVVLHPPELITSAVGTGVTGGSNWEGGRMVLTKAVKRRLLLFSSEGIISGVSLTEELCSEAQSS